MNHILPQIKNVTFIKTFFIGLLCLLIPFTNSCSSQREENLTKISGSLNNSNLRFLAMFTPDTNQEDSLNIAKDTIFSLMEANFVNPDEKQNLVICESSLENTKAHFNHVRFSQGAVHRKTTVICPDDNGKIRTLNCYYGNFAIEVVDLR